MILETTLEELQLLMLVEEQIEGTPRTRFVKKQRGVKGNEFSLLWKQSKNCNYD